MLMDAESTSGTPDMTDQERKVYDCMKRLNAVAADKGKTADDIMKFGKFPKGLMLAQLQSLEKKGIVKRLARDKAAWYYTAK